MKVRELIEQLQQYDGDAYVCGESVTIEIEDGEEAGRAITTGPIEVLRVENSGRREVILGFKT